MSPYDDPMARELLSEGEAGLGEALFTGAWEVAGQVHGALHEGESVQAVLTTLREGTLDERVVGEAPVETGGSYRLTYEPPAPSDRPSDTSLSVRLYASSGERIGESAPVLAPEAQTRIDLRPWRSGGGPSEYALFEHHVASSLEAGLGGIEGADESVIDEVATWLDVDASHLQLFQRARALESETGLPGPMYYALGRSGLRLSSEDLLDLPVHELRTTLEEALGDGIVDADALGDPSELSERLAAHVLEDALRPGREGGQPGLVEVLAAADLPTEAIEHVLQRYQGRTGPAAEFWESFASGDETAESLGDEATREVQVAVRLGEVLGVDPPLLRRMHEKRRAGEWQEPRELSGYSFDDWCDLVEEVDPGPDGEGLDEAEAAAEDEEHNEWVETRAEAILDTLEEAFPGEFIRRRLAESEALGAPARRLLERAGDHDLAAASIRARVEENENLLEGFEAGEAEDALEELEAVERVSRVSDRADEVAVLVETGLRSAVEIAAIPRRQFIDLYGEALGGRPQASRVHAQAQQTAIGSKMAAVRMLQALQRTPLVLGTPPPPAAIKGMPDARTLFQTPGGFCDCEHCGSVYSPAAYFVDLLRYLNVSSPERLQYLENRFGEPRRKNAVLEKLRQFQPLDVLLGRRPDLADLPLTCENTLTALPYIDIVNELLEAAITGTSAAFDTGKTPSDVLRAVPQNVSRDAYLRLQQAVHPLALPYHQPLALARAYLAHLGVTRRELMRTLGRGDGLRGALIAESLGMSPEEFAAVVLPQPDLWRHFGFGDAQTPRGPYLEALQPVPAFLEATGITFQNLIELVGTRFVSPDNRVQLESSSPDCDPGIVRITGLDEAGLSRMVRMIRLQRRLGWSYGDLDRALVAVGASDLDALVLEKLAVVRELVKQLDRPLGELLVLWAPIDTWGKASQFDRLFNTRAVAWRTQDARAFQLRPDRSELLETGESLDPVASALLAGFRITSEDLALIRSLLARRGAAPRLDLAGLSAVHRAVVLARALQLRLPALDLLLRLTPPDADPFRAGDPAATQRFARIVREVQASDFTPERLAYLLRHDSEPRRDPGPLPAQVDAVLGSIRRGLADAFAETSHPSQVTGETLRQKLALLLDPALLDPALEALDPRTPATPAARRDFFDRHLARLFPDPAAAAARLFATPAGAAAPAPAASVPSPPPAAAAAPARPTATAAEPAPVPAPVPAPAAAPASAPAPESSAAATPGTASPTGPLDERWKANILFVLEHLLPQLRTRQLRGAVVQTLSDTLGVSIPSTARLLDQVLRSRHRRGEPLLNDFLALLGTGLSAAIFANGELRGEPAAVRTDPELTFSWAGAPPAPGVPGRGWSARWTGRLLPRTKGAHTFYVQTDGAVRLSLKIDGTERVLIDQPASGRPTEHASQPVPLDPQQLYEIRLEYRNQGAAATLAVQLGTGPGAKQPVPTASLFPDDGLQSFAPVEQGYRRLHKAALILTGLGVTDAHLEWLTGDPRYLDLDGLPMEPGAGDGVALFRRWRQLAALYALRRKLPRSNVDLFEVFKAATMPEALERLVLATGWERNVVEAFLGPDGLGVDSVDKLRPPAEPTDEEPVILRLARAVRVQRRVGVAPATLYAWANTLPDADGAAAIVQAVKARYDETRWLEVARTLNDPLRAERRDALVAYLLPRLRELGVRDRNQLFEYFLIDVDMNPCMLTSRVQRAIAAVQTFFQRCLMNLEPKVPPRIIDDNDWKWLKNYRVWEANRKVFLYPENWIEPELRDDKSPLFQALERSILEQEIKNENVEAAFADYLEGLDEIARLDVRGVFFENRPPHRMVRQKPARLQIGPVPRSDWDNGTYHVFARTFNAPHVWYYRRLENGRHWTAWEKIEVDIEGDHLVPVIFQRRMHLFWTSFREVNKPVPPLDRGGKGPPPAAGKDWEISLAYSVYDRGRWSRKRLSAGGVVDVGTYMIPRRLSSEARKKGELAWEYQGTQMLSPSNYTLRSSVVEREGLPQLLLSLYSRVELDLHGLHDRLPLRRDQVRLITRFALNGCNGALVPERTRFVREPAMPPVWHAPRGRGRAKAFLGARPSPSASHPFRLGQGGILNVPTGYHVDGMLYSTEPGAGRALLALPTADSRGISVALRGTPASRLGVSIVPVINPTTPEDRDLYPFFFQDPYRSYFVRPTTPNWRPGTLVSVPALGPARHGGARGPPKRWTAAAGSARSPVATAARPGPPRGRRRGARPGLRSPGRVGGRAGRGLAPRRRGRGQAAPEAAASARGEAPPCTRARPAAAARATRACGPSRPAGPPEGGGPSGILRVEAAVHAVRAPGHLPLHEHAEGDRHRGSPRLQHHPPREGGTRPRDGRERQVGPSPPELVRAALRCRARWSSSACRTWTWPSRRTAPTPVTTGSCSSMHPCRSRCGSRRTGATRKPSAGSTSSSTPRPTPAPPARAASGGSRPSTRTTSTQARATS